MKILVVEDEILIQQSLKKMLEKKGATVLTASQGMDAIAIIQSEDLDKIVCDLMLGDITGFDIIEESKSKYTKEQISKKFVIITAYSSEQVLSKARNYGCAVLNKPFEDMMQALNIMMKLDSDEVK